MTADGSRLAALVVVVVVMLLREHGAGVLLVSHDLDELRICTRVLVVHRGAIVRELRDAPWDHHELIAAAEGLEPAA